MKTILILIAGFIAALAVNEGCERSSQAAPTLDSLHDAPDATPDPAPEPIDGGTSDGGPMDAGADATPAQ